MESLGPELQALVLEVAHERILIMLEAPLPDTIGSRELVSAVLGINPATARARTIAHILRAQPILWRVVEGAAPTWDEAEWKRVLNSVAKTDALGLAALAWLAQTAPATLMFQLVDAVIRQSTADGVILGNVGARLSAHLDQLGEDGTRPQWVAAVAWPLQRDEERLVRLSTVLDWLGSSTHARLLVGAVIEDAISAATAARFLSPSQIGDALTLASSGDTRVELARALGSRHGPEAVEGPVAQRQQAEFGFDLADAFAAELPAAAFAGAGEVFATLSSADKDRLTDLLADHATDDQFDALEVIVNDDHKDNTSRRVKAIARIAELVGEGGELLQSVADLLSSSRTPLRKAAVDAIATVKPRDPKLIEHLHNAVAAGGEPAKAARVALDGFAETFLADLYAATAKEEVREIAPLLGAVGRPSTFAALFAYLGEDAVYDDALLRRAAADAVRHASPFVTPVSEAGQAQLVALLEGPEQEVDPAAREALSSALARIQLGDDEALTLLHDLIGFAPRLRPDELYGGEKVALVRHLGLYARAKEQGEVGWGLAITQLDNVAERLVRAAYLVCDASSAAIKEKIERDPRDPDYGNLISALSSVGELQGIQGEASVLHNLRCAKTEVPHPGAQPTGDDMTAARRSFAELAKVCVGTLQKHAQRAAA